MTLGEIATLLGIMFSIGSVIGVYVNLQVKLGVMGEKIKNSENNLKEYRSEHKDFSNYIGEMLQKIFDKISDIEKELGQKANINYNGK